MMTNLKVCAKIHLFIIISSIFIAIGLAVGTICHFCAGGFFNYGGEFSSYKSITVSYYSSEFASEKDVKDICSDSLGGLKAYEESFAETTLGGELVYKYSSKTSTEKLQAAADGINAKIAARETVEDSVLSFASVHEGTVREGGAKAITFASIALASAAAFQFLYFIVRYKLRAAYSALLASVHNLGVFVALAAITRIPLGAEAIAIGAAVVFVTMTLTCVLFDRTRKNFASDKYEKTDRLEVIETSASETRMLTTVALGALAVAAVIYGVFAAISQMYIGALAPCVLVILGAIACFYGLIFFTPAVHGAIDQTCENVKKSLKSKKGKKPAKPAKKADGDPQKA